MHFLKKNFSVREKKVHVIRQLKSCGERWDLSEFHKHFPANLIKNQEMSSQSLTTLN
jgi:hypothetical protein